MHQHDDGDGDSGQTRTAAETEQAADDDRDQYGENVIPRKHAEHGEREAEKRAYERSKQAVARRAHRRSYIGLQDDDGAYGAPIAVVQAEAQRQPPAECRCQRRLCSVNQEAPVLPGKES